MGKLQVKRVYDAPEETDGSRVLWTGCGPGALRRKRLR